MTSKDDTTNQAASQPADQPGTGQTPAGPRRGVLTNLYMGTGGFNIVGRRKFWYSVTGVIVLVCVASMVFRGFTPGIEFVGGTQIQMPSQTVTGTVTADQAKEVFTEVVGAAPASAQTIGSGDSASIQLRSDTLTPRELAAVKTALFEEFQPLDNDDQPSADAISDSGVSGSWGGEISRKALTALAVFLVLVTLFLSLYFERKMAAAALAALGYDLITTAGAYSIIGFEVTPATVIGLLTIMGYSLYDTVVVFDKVTENTRGLLGLTRQTYGEAANLGLNQTLMRSINTSVTSLLPVLGLLLIGAGLLGAGTLKDLALVMSVGIATGTFSSIFLATPVLVDLKMRERRFKEQAARVHARRENMTRRAAERAEAEAAGPQDISDEGLADAERREKAMAAAAGVPARQQSRAGSRSGRRPASRGGRPSGKRRR